MTKCGTLTAGATITAAPPAAMPACASLRLRARFVTRSNVRGFGSNGFTRSLSQMSMSSRGSSMGFPQHRAEPGPRVMQVGLDRPLRPAQHLRDVPDGEAGVIVQQERPAQPVRQALNEGPHIHILRRTVH